MIAALDRANIRLVVFDMDGTLYRQGPVRRAMAAALIGETIRTRSTTTVRLLAAYRRAREAMPGAREGFDRALIETLAGRQGLPPADAAQRIEDWMHRRPLAAVSRARRPEVVELFQTLGRSGRRCAVWSDYPAEAKLQALGLAADAVVDAAHPEVLALKPHPAGLQWLMARLDASPAQTLMIGDRDERDGAAARAAGVRAVILPQWKSKRLEAAVAEALGGA